MNPPSFCVQIAVHYAWIPFIIYVGYTRSNPQPSLIKCVHAYCALLSPYSPSSRLISPLA